jgi:fatty acid-binding protein DegV
MDERKQSGDYINLDKSRYYFIDEEKERVQEGSQPPPAQFEGAWLQHWSAAWSVMQVRGQWQPVHI